MTRKYSKAPSHRQLQIGQEIRGVLAEYFARQEYYHPLLESTLITISEVRISADLRLATIFILLPNDINTKNILSILKEMTPIMRKVLATKLQLRFTPEIRFLIDETQENLHRVGQLFSQLHKK